MRRPRLTRLLDDSTAQAIVITAPAGYGKTTLAKEWLKGRERVGWYRATPTSADVAAFSQGIANAVTDFIPNAGERLAERLRVAESPERAVRQLAELLADDFTAWPQDGWLVLEDYHLLTESAPVEEFVDWLLTLAPTRFLVTTRRRPSWASARRLLYGEIAEITQSQLQMTDAEVSRALEDRSTDTVSTLIARAAGWPALIGLAAIATSTRLPNTLVADALFRYFAEEVLRQQPSEIQGFMLAASVPLILTEDVARNALGLVEADAQIQRVVNAGLLHEVRPQSFHFHPLLREFLLARLRAEAPVRHTALVENVVTYARARHDWDEAFDLAREANRIDLATEVASEASDFLLRSGRLETVEKWLAVCGPQGLRFSSLRLARAHVALRQARLYEAQALATDVARTLKENDGQAALAWNLAGSAAHLLSDDKAALSNHLNARRLARNDRDRKTALWGMVLASIELELDEAESYLREFGKLAADNIDGQLRLWAGQQLLAARRGTFAGLVESAERLLPLVDHAVDPMAKTNFLANLAWTYVAHARYDVGRDLADRALALCETLHLDFAMGVCLAYRATAEIGLREFRQVQQTLAHLRTIAARQDDPYLAMAHAFCSAKRDLARGRHFLYEEDFVSREISKSSRGEFYGLAALSSAVAGDSQTAIRFEELACSVTTSVEASFLSDFSAVVRSLAQAGDDSSVSRARSVTVSCIASGYLDGIVIAYRAYPALLRILSEPLSLARRIKSLVFASRDEEIGREAGLLPPVAAADGGLRNHLTPRESEVLSLVGEGLSNAEIAARLFISPSTAKVHVHHILEKLGVGTRVQAALYARNLASSAS